MSAVVLPLVAFGVWALVALAGTIGCSLILMVMTWAGEYQETKSKGVKSLPPVKIPSRDTESSPKPVEDEDASPTAVLSETVSEGEASIENEEEETKPVDAPCRVLGEPQTGFLLPPRIPGDPRRLTVVLDLDETLVRSCEENEVPIQLELAATMGLLQRCEIMCQDPQGGPPEKIISFLRPGVLYFLDQLSLFAEVVVFTAGDPEYAGPLVGYLDPEEKFVTANLYRESTVKTVFHDHVKDLSKLGRDPRYTVLVDNNPFSFLFQPDNGILCDPFYGDPTDQHLTQVMLPLLKILSCVNDVRPILRRRYNLAGWCNSLPWQQRISALQQQGSF